MTTNTPTVRITLPSVPVHVARRLPFDCNGTLRGISGAYEGMGKLPEHWHSRFITAGHADDKFFVYSYRTPIAWFANGEWTVPGVKYSPTTSRHQTQVRRGIHA